jgi:hypothetical protein
MDPGLDGALESEADGHLLSGGHHCFRRVNAEDRRHRLEHDASVDRPGILQLGTFYSIAMHLDSILSNRFGRKLWIDIVEFMVLRKV